MATLPFVIQQVSSAARVSEQACFLAHYLNSDVWAHQSYFALFKKSEIAVYLFGVYV